MKHRSILLALLSLLSLLALALPACEPVAPPGQSASVQDPVTLSATVDKSSATLGDVITYTLELSHDESLDVPLPDVGNKLRGLSLADLTEEHPKSLDGRILKRRIYSLRADLVGSYRLPEVIIDLGEEQIIAPSIFIEVKSVLDEDEDAQLVDIKGPIRPEGTLPLKWIVALILAVVVIALAFGAWMWTKRGALSAPPPPPPPPWEVAFAHLKRLRSQRPESTEAHRLFAFELSELLRRYLEGRFQTSALEQTSSEILAQLRKGGRLYQRLTPEQEGQMTAFLAKTDQAKYAKYQPTNEEIEVLLDIAHRLVESTRPAPQAPDSEQPPGEVPHV